MPNYVRMVGARVGAAMARWREADFIMLGVEMAGKGLLCPTCSKSYKRRGWLHRHLRRRTCA